MWYLYVRFVSWSWVYYFLILWLVLAAFVEFHVLLSNVFCLANTHTCCQVWLWLQQQSWVLCACPGPMTASGAVKNSVFWLGCLVLSWKAYISHLKSAKCAKVKHIGFIILLFFYSPPYPWLPGFQGLYPQFKTCLHSTEKVILKCAAFFGSNNLLGYRIVRDKVFDTQLQCMDIPTELLFSLHNEYLSLVHFFSVRKLPFIPPFAGHSGTGWMKLMNFEV